MRTDKEGPLAVKAKSAKSTKTTKATKKVAATTKTKKVTKAVATEAKNTKSTGWKWATLLTVSLATFIVAVNTTILNVSMADVVKDVDTGVTGLQSAIALYALVMAAFILPASKLGNRWGKKKTFIVGLVLFAAGAVAASYSSSLLNLIASWSILAGIGGALMLPQVQGLVSNDYSGRDRTLAYGVLGAVAASAVAFGPIAGGLITDSADWVWNFRGLAIISVLVLLLSFTVKGQVSKEVSKLDLNAVWLNGAGMFLVVVGALLSAKYGFIEPRQEMVIDDIVIAPFGLSLVAIMIGLGFVFMVLAYLRAKKNEAAKLPGLFKPSLLKNRQIAVGLVAQVFQPMLLVGSIFGLALFMQSVLKLDPVDAGVGLLPLAVTILIVSFAAPRLGRRFFPKNIIGVGFLLTALGLFLVDTVIQEGVGTVDMAPGLVVLGLGIGLLVSQLQNLVLSSDDKADATDVAGLNGSAQQFGSALGTAVIGTFVIVGLTFGFGDALKEQAVYNAQDQELLSSTVEEDFNNLNSDKLDELLAAVPEEVITEIRSVKSQADFDAMKSALGLMAVVAVIGFLTSLKIPAKKLS